MRMLVRVIDDQFAIREDTGETIIDFTRFSPQDARPKMDWMVALFLSWDWAVEDLREFEQLALDLDAENKNPYWDR